MAPKNKNALEARLTDADHPCAYSEAATLPRDRPQDADDSPAAGQPQEPPIALRRSAHDLGESGAPPPKRLKSPSNSAHGPEDTPVSTPASTPAHMDESTSDFPVRPPVKPRSKLWVEGDPALPRSGAVQPRASRGSARRQHAPKSSNTQPPGDEHEDPSVSQIIRQPETRPISQQQLVAEVKGIYAGLVLVESKCIEVDSAQSAQGEDAAKLNNEQWQALIALHRTLLHEHHDFFLASQHPSASPPLRRLAQKYAMPARMWRHGIHSFLELLRHCLPASLEHMLTFIYLAYSMMALLYETVPAFEDTWIECLGDLGRYRMAIEDEDIRDREIWTAVSRHWYSRASDKAPTTGRLYHHLAILARPNAIQQLFYYTKSLCVAIPFKSARDSILTLFDPILNGSQSRLQPIDFSFVKTHAILFIASNINEKEKSLPKPVDEMMPEYAKTKDDFVSQLDIHIARTTRSWLEPGAFIGIANCNALLEYGKNYINAQGHENVIMAVINPEPGGQDAHMHGAADDYRPLPSKIFSEASELVKECDSVIFKRYGDPNILPYLHTRLAFVLYMADKPLAMEHLENTFLWTQVALLLTSLTFELESFDRIEAKDFPRPFSGGSERPLPEDWNLCGLLWTEGLYPDDWFTGARVDDDEKSFELASMEEHRRERVLWLGCRLASFKKWIVYDEESKRFQATREFHQEVHDFAAEDATLGGQVDSISRASTFASTITLSASSDTGDEASIVVEKGE